MTRVPALHTRRTPARRPLEFHRGLPGLTILAVFLLVTGCASGEDAEHAAHEPSHDHGSPAGDPLPATDGPGYRAADVRFMQDMIGHHAQALLMAALAPDRGAGEQVLWLAHKIDISQEDEIRMMEQWLAERGQAVPDREHAHTMHMPGMVTPEQFARLEAARGTDFDRLFLTLMIQHHEGALEMVDALFASPGAAQDPDIFRFITDVGADQGDEIHVMDRLLEQLDATSRSDSR